MHDMHDRDCLHRFLFEHYPIRGHIVHLDASWRALLEHREYPQPIRDTLGEAVAASVLLAATLKFDGTLSLQLQGQGPMHLMLAQCSSQLGVRAVARYREAPEIDNLARDVLELSGEGNLTVTLENEDLSQRYQGVVPLSCDRLAGCLQQYFANSEQLPTRLWLHADENGVSGLLLQRLSNDSIAHRTVAGLRAPLDPADVEDAWNRVQLLGDTLKPTELRTLTDQQILHRLFAENPPRCSSAAAARASGSRECSAAWGRGKSAPCWRSGATSRCAATSAIAHIGSIRWMRSSFSPPAHLPTEAGQFTSPASHFPLIIS